MTDAADEMMPELTNFCLLSVNVRHFSRMLYMEDIIQQRNHAMNQQLKLIDAANAMARAAKKKTLRQRFSDLEKVLELERESGELSAKLKEAESERLMLKHYISEENITRINKYIEASELLTNRVRRDLLERDSQLRRMEEVLVSAWGRLRNLSQSEQDLSSHLLHPSNIFTDSGQRVPCRGELDGQWDKLKKALRTKEEEITYLQHLLRDQKEEMEVKWAALEEKLLRQAKDGESHARRLCEKDQSSRKKFSHIKSQVRKDLFEKEEYLKKELSDINEGLSGELWERCEQLGKELSQREEGLKMEVLEMSKKELSESNKNLQTELSGRLDGLAQRRDLLEKELVQSTKNQLSESEEQFQKELSEREKDFNRNLTKEHFAKELSERNDSFKKELVEKAEDFREELLQMEERLKKEASERKHSFLKKLLEQERSHQMESSENPTDAREVRRQKMKRLTTKKDKSSKPEVTHNQQKVPSASVQLSDITVRQHNPPPEVLQPDFGPEKSACPYLLEQTEEKEDEEVTLTLRSTQQTQRQTSNQ